jgi:hypothetical protein
MAENMSLADQAVQVLAMVRAMGEGGMGIDRPERHAVRNLKREAEAILAEAFRRAEGLAYLARDLPELVQTVRNEEAQRAADVTGS